jgi:hypothetical protein
MAYVSYSFVVGRLSKVHGERPEGSKRGATVRRLSASIGKSF